MHAGMLRHRVTLETASYADRASGGKTRTWVSSTSVWAHVRALSSSEATLMQALQGITMYEVTVRYRTGLGTELRITMADGRVLESTGFVVDDKKQWVRIMARQERVGVTT